MYVQRERGIAVVVVTKKTRTTTRSTAAAATTTALGRMRCNEGTKSKGDMQFYSSVGAFEATLGRCP